jgi:hypothetical protein
VVAVSEGASVVATDTGVEGEAIGLTVNATRSSVSAPARILPSFLDGRTFLKLIVYGDGVFETTGTTISTTVGTTTSGILASTPEA